MSSEYGQVADEEWRWPCKVVEVTDGDSLVLLIDRGFEDRSVRKVRLLGVDTAEIHFVDEDSEEYHIGMKQKRFVEDWLDVDSDEEFPLTLHTYDREGKYGRWLGDVSYNGNSLSEAILEEWPMYHY